MYGRMITVHHVSPYTHVPADFPTDPFVHRVDPQWRHTGSVYGPLFVAYAAAVSPGGRHLGPASPGSPSRAWPGSRCSPRCCCWRGARWTPPRWRASGLHPWCSSTPVGGGHNDPVVGSRHPARGDVVRLEAGRVGRGRAGPRRAGEGRGRPGRGGPRGVALVSPRRSRSAPDPAVGRRVRGGRRDSATPQPGASARSARSTARRSCRTGRRSGARSATTSTTRPSRRPPAAWPSCWCWPSPAC